MCEKLQNCISLVIEEFNSFKVSGTKLKHPGYLWVHNRIYVVHIRFRVQSNEDLENTTIKVPLRYLIIVMLFLIISEDGICHLEYQLGDQVSILLEVLRRSHRSIYLDHLKQLLRLDEVDELLLGEVPLNVKALLVNLARID